jgi:uncharacterized membrane protein
LDINSDFDEKWPSLPERVDTLGNLHLLFWSSLLAFATAWMDEVHYSSAPAALYGAGLLMAAVGYLVQQHRVIQLEGADSTVKRAVGSNWKGKLSLLAHRAATVLEPCSPWLPQVLLIAAALVWLIPDRRIEHRLRER